MTLLLGFTVIVLLSLCAQTMKKLIFVLGKIGGGCVHLFIANFLLTVSVKEF